MRRSKERSQPRTPKIDAEQKEKKEQTTYDFDEHIDWSATRRKERRMTRIVSKVLEVQKSLGELLTGVDALKRDFHDVEAQL